MGWIDLQIYKPDSCILEADFHICYGGTLNGGPRGELGVFLMLAIHRWCFYSEIYEVYNTVWLIYFHNLEKLLL